MLSYRSQTSFLLFIQLYERLSATFSIHKERRTGPSERRMNKKQRLRGAKHYCDSIIHIRRTLDVCLLSCCYSLPLTIFRCACRTLDQNIVRVVQIWVTGIDRCSLDVVCMCMSAERRRWYGVYGFITFINCSDVW